MKLVDDFLDSITMYRLVLYFLILLAGVGFIYSIFGVLPYDPINYVFSFTLLLVASGITNYVFAIAFDAPTNIESVYISALILGLIIVPPVNFTQVLFVAWAGVLAMSSKFILTISKKHVFNPVAVSVALTAFFINGTASWWVGVPSMLPFVAIGGFLIVRKIRRWDLVLSFLGTALTVIFVSTLLKGSNPLNITWRSLTDTPLLFFAAIMITEPLTTPPTKTLRIIYGAIVGFLFAPDVHLGSIFTTPEIALIIGNIYSYIVSPKYKVLLTLKDKLRLTPDTYDFVFATDSPIKFTPGQYMEFTFPHPESDSRGVRRYLSLASSPTENELRLGVKFGSPPSSFKKSLLKLTPDQKIAAGQLIGDFVMPKDKSKKLVFMAGGIGITPYRSMLQYLIDKGERRDIAVFYSATNQDDFVYRDVLARAKEKLGIKVILIPTSSTGHIGPKMVAEYLPDYGERTYYISGSHGVVVALKDVVKRLGVGDNQIITDYFPGFA